MKVAVIVFPGTNSETETRDACAAAGLDAVCFHWSMPPESLRAFDAYVLAGGFAYEDRVRAGAIAAKSSIVAVVTDESRRGKLVLGICNGAQVLAESGVLGEIAIARNLPSRRFECRFVDVTVDGRPERCAFTAGLQLGTRLRMVMAHAEGRFRAEPEVFDRLEREGRIVLRYAGETPNGSMHGAAGVCNAEGNVLALMPHPERASWAYNLAFADAGLRPGNPNRTVGAHALFGCMYASLGGLRTESKPAAC
ncbi:MAG: phosphoribosylformylglycinamidine synthase I [Candidatus Eremiobacteraeota bacterium]|nr:phosphoribosylformylglycinamidine synthase I [Candidatus Eremiobacteraeota bacterium]